MYIKLKELRQSRNLTQNEISKILKITASQYSLYETGKRSIPISLLSQLAKYYNTSIDYLVGDTDEINPYR